MNKKIGLSVIHITFYKTIKAAGQRKRWLQIVKCVK